MQEAYNVGCMGKAECFLLSLNPYTDMDNEEFFGPRNNTAKKEYQFEISYVGELRESFSWMPYVAMRKNQGATNTCYLQVWASMVEIKMTKKLRDMNETMCIRPMSLGKIGEILESGIDGNKGHKTCRKLRMISGITSSH